MAAENVDGTAQPPAKTVAAYRLVNFTARESPRIAQVEPWIWLASFMQYKVGYVDDETCRIESAENPFAANLSPMSPV